jgi:cytochrome d ubiquinol oxidase subunit II
MVLDYETLKLIWWLLIGVLLIGFALTDGFDLGVGMLLPFISKSDEESRIMLNTVGPHWEGNQVWLVTAGGALFAAWPLVYAMAFSGFYMAMLLTLFALFLRPVGFDYRSKLSHPRWRSGWDWGLFIGSAVPALIFGVAFGNLLQGVPFHFDDFMRPIYTGHFWQLLNPFGLLCGVVSVAMLVMHGAVWLQLRTAGDITARATQVAKVAAIVTGVAFISAGIFINSGIEGFVLDAIADTNQTVTPNMKEVSLHVGGWMHNYGEFSWTLWAPVLGIVGAVVVYLASLLEKHFLAFLASCISVTSIILTAGFAMFPFVMPSSSHPNQSLTLWDATSSELTLSIMFWVAVVFVPIILLYSLWTYRKMWQRLDVAFIENNSHSTY